MYIFLTSSCATGVNKSHISSLEANNPDIGWNKGNANRYSGMFITLTQFFDEIMILILFSISVFFFHSLTQTSRAAVIQSVWRTERSRMTTSLRRHGKNLSILSDLRRVVLTTMTVFGVQTLWGRRTKSIFFKWSFRQGTTSVLSLRRARLSTIPIGWRNIGFSTPWTARTSRCIPRMELLRYGVTAHHKPMYCGRSTIRKWNAVVTGAALGK